MLHHKFSVINSYVNHSKVKCVCDLRHNGEITALSLLILAILLSPPPHSLRFERHKTEHSFSPFLLGSATTLTTLFFGNSPFENHVLPLKLRACQSPSFINEVVSCQSKGGIWVYFDDPAYVRYVPHVIHPKNDLIL